MTGSCSTPGCQRSPRLGWAICDADVLDLVAPAPRPAQQPDLADVALGPVASRDAAAGSTEAPCPAASRHAGAREPRGSGAGVGIHGLAAGADSPIGASRRPTEIPFDAIARFWGLIDRSAGEDGCWPWLGARSEKGYGLFTVDSRNRRAHRIAFRLFIGPIEDVDVVCHRCDNPPCVNPAHLWRGSVADNNRDMHAKGRAAAPPIGRPLAMCRNRLHVMAGDNLYLGPAGRRRCRACAAAYEAERALTRVRRSRLSAGVPPAPPPA